MQPCLKWKSNKYYIFWVRIWSLKYPAWNAHAPYCRLWPVRLKIFHQIIWHNFRKTVIEHACGFFTTFVWIISYSKKNWASYDQTSILVFMQNTRYSCQILMKLEFSPQIFEEYWNIKFHENPSSGIKGCSMRSDGHNETNNSLSQFFERA